MVKFAQFCNFYRALRKKISVLKSAAQAFEAGYYLNILLRFWAFRGSFSYKNFSYKKNVYNEVNSKYLQI